METRTLVIADELFGPRGEAAEIFSQLVLCLEPETPRQFLFHTPFHGSIKSLCSKVDIDIAGKKPWRIILGLGLRELRLGVEVQTLFNTFKDLLQEISKRISSEIYVVTIPEAALPDAPSVLLHWNALLNTLDLPHVTVLDFAKAEAEFQKRQSARGKYSRNLWEESGAPAPICLMLLALFLQRKFKTQSATIAQNSKEA